MRNHVEPGETGCGDEPSVSDEREASLPPQPEDDVFARATRPGGDDVFARVTRPVGDDVFARATALIPARREAQPRASHPSSRPTAPGVYPDAASEAALGDAHARATVEAIRRPPSERPARPTEPLARTFTPAAPLPFLPSPILPPAREPASTALPLAREPASTALPASTTLPPAPTSLSPVSTSHSGPWSVTSSGALPAVSRRRPHLALAAIGVAIVIGGAAAWIGRALHRPEASAAERPVIVAVVTATATPAAPEPTEPAEPAPHVEPTPPARASIAPAKAKPTAAPRARATASPARAPHRPFDVESD